MANNALFWPNMYLCYLTILFGIALYFIASYGIFCYLMVLQGMAWYAVYRMVSHVILWYLIAFCIVFHAIALLASVRGLCLTKRLSLCIHILKALVFHTSGSLVASFPIYSTK